MADLTVDYDVTADLPACVFTAPTGLKFGSWNTKTDGTGTAYGASVKNLAAADGAIVTLYAQWIDKNAHTITYHNTKGAANSNPKPFLESQPITLSDITADGYTFDGWYDASADGDQVTGWAAGAKTDNVTLWARWTPKTYNVSLDPNGGDGSPVTVIATFGSDLTADIPTRTGYDFGGYYLDNTNDANKKYIKADGVSTKSWDLTSDTTLLAKWTPKTYTVTLDPEGGSGGTETVTATYGVVLPNITKPHKTGYNFEGYYLDNTNDQNKKYINSDGSGAKSWDLTSDKTLYAKWTPKVCGVGFRLFLDSGTNLFDNGITNQGTEDTTVDYGTRIRHIEIPSRDFYTFEGYYYLAIDKYVDASGDGCKDWNLEGYIDDQEPVCLYAKWTPITYTITFDNTVDASFADGYTPPTSYTYESNKITLPTADNITRPGYTFGGWYTDSVFTEPAVTEIPAQSYGNKTFYAKWSAKSYPVTLDPNGGTGGPTETVNVRYGSAFNSIDTINLPERDGYRFAGYWSETSGGTQYINAGGIGARNLDIDNWDTGTNTANTTTLYAHWTPITYTIMFDGNGGSSTEMDNLSMTYGVAKNLTTNTFEKTGYNFAGWNTKADGSGNSYTDGQSVNNLTTADGAIAAHSAFEYLHK